MPPQLPLNLESQDKPDADYIRAMFDRMARGYDTFTLLTGFGQAQRWRSRALSCVGPGMRVLDLGCGTGDLALGAWQRSGESGAVVGLDFSEHMLAVARSKARALARPGCGSLRWMRGKAEDLPLDEDLFDVVVSGFVLRNLYANIGPILAGVRRSLKPGGRIRFLDLTEPRAPLLRRLLRLYLLGPTGLYGAALFGRDYPIPYLPDSASRFFKAEEFVAALAREGFSQIQAHSFMFGAVMLYHAVNP
jgi:demethylmenaquinone methyltransferase/2-methoxy-6-polyprenyl-1,4-benzoquinol methylase